MNEIEELCDRIFMIHKGTGVLYGKLDEIKAGYRSNSVLLECEGEPGELTGAVVKYIERGVMELVLEKETSPQEILEQLVNGGIKVYRFEVATPPLNDIFLQVVGETDE